MTPEQQRIAIAEACGWKRGHTGATHWVSDPYGIRMGWSSMREVTDNALPDYLNDLNAMHEAEKVLKSEQHFTYQIELARAISTITYPLNFALLHATAPQRAEAFLRTLNLWTT